MLIIVNGKLTINETCSIAMLVKTRGKLEFTRLYLGAFDNRGTPRTNGTIILPRREYARDAPVHPIIWTNENTHVLCMGWTEVPRFDTSATVLFWATTSVRQ